MEKNKNLFFDEIILNVVQLSQSLINRYFEQKQNNKNSEPYELLKILSETYKCFKLLKCDKIIEDYEHFIKKKNCLNENQKLFLKSLIYYDKDIEQSITCQNKITDVNERYINKIQIADYLKLKGDYTNACVEHLDIISKIDFRNEKAKHQFDFYDNYHSIKQFGINYHDLISKPILDIDVMKKFKSYEKYNLFYSLHSTDERFTTLMDQNQLEGSYSDAWITDAFRRKLDLKIIDYIQNINPDPPDIFWLSNQNSDSKHLKYLEKYLISDTSQMSDLDHYEFDFQIGCAVLTENYDLANKISKKIFADYEGDYFDYFYQSCVTWGLETQANMWRQHCDYMDYLYSDMHAMNNLAYQGKSLQYLLNELDLEPVSITYEWILNKKCGGFPILTDLNYALKSFICSDFDKLILNKYKISELNNSY